MGSTLSQSSVISTDDRLMRFDVLVLRTVPSQVVTPTPSINVALVDRSVTDHPQDVTPADMHSRVVEPADQPVADAAVGPEPYEGN